MLEPSRAVKDDDMDCTPYPSDNPSQSDTEQVDFIVEDFIKQPTKRASSGRAFIQCI